METNANILTKDKRTPKVAIYCRVASPDQAQFCRQQEARPTKYGQIPQSELDPLKHGKFQEET